MKKIYVYHAQKILINNCQLCQLKKYYVSFHRKGLEKKRTTFREQQAMISLQKIGDKTLFGDEYFSWKKLKGGK